MAREAELPDGTILEFPDGTPDAVIDKTVKSHLSASASKPAERPNPFKENSFIDNMAAGAANAWNRGVLGLSQLGANFYPGEYGRNLRANLAEQKKADDLINEQVNKTGGGFVGGLAANTALTAPTMLIPGANTYAGSAAIGAGLGAIQPVSNDAERGWNTVLGAGAGVAGKAVGDKVGGFLADRLASKTQAAAAQAVQNEGRDTALRTAQQAGYVVPPTQANPSVVNKALEGFSGKIATAQNASAKNQKVTNKLVKQELGLADDAPLSTKVLESLRSNAGQAYQTIKDLPTRFRVDQQFKDDIAKLGNDFAEAAKEYPDIAKVDAVERIQKSLLGSAEMSPKAAIELVKKLRFDASKNLKSFDDAERAALGMAQRDAANAIDDLVERALGSDPTTATLSQAYRQARQTIAKSYDVQAALNDSTGNVSARVLGNLLKKGKPMTGGLEKAGQFAQAFPKAAQDVEKMGSLPQLSPLDYLSSVLSGAVGGGPAGLAALVARPVARAGILSPAYQRTMVQPPAYAPGLAAKLPPALLNERTLQPAILGGLLSYGAQQ